MGLVETWTRDVVGTMTSFRFRYCCTASQFSVGPRCAQSLQSVQRREEICVSAVGTYRPLLYKKTFVLPCELIAVQPRRPSALENPYCGEA